MDGRLKNAAQFGDIIIKSADGAVLKLKDVAEVELGAASYAADAMLNGKDAIPLLIFMQNDANALATAKAVNAKLDELSKNFPAGFKHTIAIAALVAMALGKTIGLNDRISIQTQMNEKNLNGMVRLIRYILASSLLIEGAGALLLSIRFVPEFGMFKGIFYGVFHSISAYCNAGFDLFGDSLIGF